MGRAPCCSKVGLHRGPWTPREDALLTNYIQSHGEGNWRNLPKNAGLLRCGKSCRLRWMNYLRPDIKRGNIGPEEEDLIVRLHKLLGNRWSLIAGRLPGRTDNEIKNYWNSHLSKRLKRQGLELREGRSKVTSKRSQQTQTSDGNIKKQDKRKKVAGLMEVIEETQTRIEIHVPKPRRFTSILRRSNVMETSDVSDFKIGSTSSDDQKGDASEGNIELGDIDWSDVNEGSLFIDHGFSFELPSEDRSLERLYQEYSQLLNSEDDQLRMIPFTESFFI